MEGIINYLTEVWQVDSLCQYRSALKFNMVIKFPMAKMWMQFISSRLAPTHNASDVTTYREIILYSILQRDEICIDHWIYKEMLKCIRSRKQSMYFSHLIIDLYRQADVLMPLIEPFRRPMRSVIVDNLYD